MLLQIFLYVFLFWILIELVLICIITSTVKLTTVPEVTKSWSDPEEFGKAIDKYISVLQQMQKGTK